MRARKAARDKKRKAKKARFFLKAGHMCYVSVMSRT